MRLILLISAMLIFSGCAKSKPKIDPFEYDFEKTVEKETVKSADKRLVTIRFDGVPFTQAMSILSQETNATIVWNQTLDTQTVYGSYVNISLHSVLETLARRCGVSVTEFNGVYYLGQIRKEDRVFAVVRIPPVDRAEIMDSLKSASSATGSSTIIGSCLWICDDMESVRKTLAALEMIREMSERSYIAEVYFIRVNEEHFVKLTADLKINQVDIFSSSFNVEQLFSMFIDGDGGTGFSKVIQRPVLYLSEGRKFLFEDGDEITREQKSITEKGIIETTGYARFTDGTRLEMMLSRVSDSTYMVDFDLSVSIFDRNDSATVPKSRKTALKSPGIRVQDSSIYYVGSLGKESHGNKFGVFSGDFQKSHDMLTV